MKPDAIDLRAERERSLARRQAEADVLRRRRQAQRVLSGDRIHDAQWNASRAALKTTIAERYPKMRPAERRELLAVTLELQQTERPHVDPTTVHTTPPAPKNLVRQAPRRAPHPTFEATEEEDTAVATTKAKPVDLRTFTEQKRDQLLDVVKEAVAANPNLTPEQAQAIVAERLGWQLRLGQIARYIEKAVPPADPVEKPATPSLGDRLLSRPSDEWDEGRLYPVRETAPASSAQAEARTRAAEDDATPAEGEANGSSAEANEANPDEAAAPYRGADRVSANGNGAHAEEGVPALGAPARPEWIGARARDASEIVDGERELRASEQLRAAERQIAQLLQEVRSLRGAYETGDFSRVDQEDGEWVLRTCLTFDDRAAAFGVLALLGRAVATCEADQREVAGG